jgi:hypothetical protein
MYCTYLHCARAPWLNRKKATRQLNLLYKNNRNNMLELTEEHPGSCIYFTESRQFNSQGGNQIAHMITMVELRKYYL